MDGQYYKELLRPLFEGRKVVLIGQPLAGATVPVEFLNDYRADSVLVVANGVGTGPLPDPAEATSFVIDTPAADLLEDLRQNDAMLASLPAEARAAIDGFDPEGRALVMLPFFGHCLEPDVGGREVFGHRRREWTALEDKSTIDGLWDELGVRRAPSETVAVDSLASAAARIDQGAGTVWSGDIRDGHHGGATLVRWVVDDADASAATALLTANCDRARVMPFLEGVPCSIHGMVFPDAVIAFRPVEMVVLRRARPRQFVYAGCGTFWDPPDDDREYMRVIARRVGEALAERVGYGGAFPIDGV